VLTLVVNISDRIKDVQRGKKYSRAKKEFLVDKSFVLFDFIIEVFVKLDKSCFNRSQT